MGFWSGLLEIVSDFFNCLAGGKFSFGRAIPPPIYATISSRGEDIQTTAAPSDTILNLKCTVHVKTGKAVAGQKIYFQGEECQDNRTLESYNIRSGSTVQISFDYKELTW